MKFSQLAAQLPKDGEWFTDEEQQRVYTGFEFEAFEQAVDFLNEIADMAIELDVIPDLYLYDRLVLQISFKPLEGEEFAEKTLELMLTIDELFASLGEQVEMEAVN